MPSRLAPLQGFDRLDDPRSQGVALGCVLLPFQGGGALAHRDSRPPSSAGCPIRCFLAKVGGSRRQPRRFPTLPKTEGWGTRMSCSCVAFRVAMLAVFLLAVPITQAQQNPRNAQRLRGIIDRDQTWSGHVIITDDLQILGATVRVQPGTLVEFAQAVLGGHPTLTVGSEHRDRGELILLSTSKRPITFRSRPDTNPGRLTVYLRGRMVSALAPTNKLGQAPAPPERRPADLTWRHVRFERLGYPHRSRRGAENARRHEPAVTINLIGTSHTVKILDCDFDASTRVRIRADDDCRITIDGNHFRDCAERVALEIDGTSIKKSAGAVTVSKNRLAAVLSLMSVPALIRDNILIGRRASMVVRDPTDRPCEVIGNYIHNSTKDDDGRYCFDTDAPETIIRNNIFRGGTACVLNGSRKMHGNVFIGAPDLASQLVKKSRTHQLVGALPASSIFSYNLLIGPAHALLIPHPVRSKARQGSEVRPTRIERNVFDGLGDSHRAIHINPIGRLDAQLYIAGNLFLRVPTLIYDESPTNATVVYTDANAFTLPPDRAFGKVTVGNIKRGETGWSSRDIHRKDVAGFGLSATPPSHLPDFDADLQSGNVSIAHLRQRLFERYRPRPDSPLVGAGPLHDGKRQSIGPLEPADQ